MDKKKWKLVRSNKVFDTPYIVINDNDYLLPNGKKAEHYYQLERGDYVLVLAFNNEGKILVEMQYRWGVEDLVYELPSGWINQKEDSVEAAKRECEEETGYIISNVQKLGVIYAQPGFCNMSAHIVRGDISKNIGKKPEFDEENIDVTFLSLDEIKTAIKKGEIKDMGFISAIPFL